MFSLTIPGQMSRFVLVWRTGRIHSQTQRCVCACRKTKLCPLGRELSEPESCSRSEVSVHLQRVESSMDHSDCSGRTLDDFSVLYTSPNVGSAYKRICFQSILPFSPLVPRLKYIMVQLMMKEWLCSSGRRGGENEGGIAEAFRSATRRSLQRWERLEKVLYCVCVCVWIHTSRFHSTAMQMA